MCDQGICICICIWYSKMDSDNMKKQTLNWVDSIPRNKLNASKMVMIIKNDVPKFIPKHLL